MDRNCDKFHWPESLETKGHKYSAQEKIKAKAKEKRAIELWLGKGMPLHAIEAIS